MENEEVAAIVPPATVSDLPPQNDPSEKEEETHKKEEWWKEWWLQSIPMRLDRLTHFEEWDTMTWAAVGGATILLLPYLWPLLRTILGTSLGIALGLGWATHICNQLDRWEERQLQKGETPPRRHRTLSSVASRRSWNHSSAILPLSASDHPNNSTTALLQDEQTYESLMASAGYAALDRLRRGQVVRPDQLPPVRYTFLQEDRARTTLQRLFADHVPLPVQSALAKAVECILRDFCAPWYALIDTGCLDPSSSKIPEPPSGVTPNDSVNGKNPDAEDPAASSSHLHARVMLYSLAIHRPIPFLDALYHNCAMIFGNLATRVEQVNAPQLILCHFTRVLAHSFQNYRHLRKLVRDKQRLSTVGAANASPRASQRALRRGPSASSSAAYRRSHIHTTNSSTNSNQEDPFVSTMGPPISEMAMTKEFLIQGKLHKALTFGLDVPSLLYADATGHDGPATATPDELLAQRLFQTPLLQECELDYHRVLGHKMVKALLPRHEFGSTLLHTLLTEIMAGSVLTPILSLFAPDTVSSWIVMGLSPAAPPLDPPTEATLPPPETRASLSSSVHEAAGPVAVDTARTSVAPTPRTAVVDHESLTRLLALTLMELEPLVDFDSVRSGDGGGQAVDWDGEACRTAIVRLVLVLEAAILQGRCTYRKEKPEENATLPSLLEEEELPLDDDTAAEEVEVTLPDYESTSWTQLLMEMTGDLDAFEQRVATDNILLSEEPPPWVPLIQPPTATEISSLRTLIAAWLERGQIYRTVTLLVQAHATVLAPYYHPAAFLRSSDDAHAFVRQLQPLDQVPILVDTVTVLSSPRLEEGPPSLTARPTPTTPSAQPPPMNALRGALSPSSAVPRYLDFHRNESLAASLRSERERRQQSWDRLLREDAAEAVRSKAPGDGLHKELHHIAMLFYYETVLLSIRDAARRAPDGLVALLTVEAAGPKRRLEIPDDDSSFLLRGPPRVLNAVGVHRDPRNHDHSYKSFAGHIEEVAQNEYYTGGRYLRRCLLRYYPSDRTASVDRLDDARKLDQRKSAIPETITLSKSTLSDEFMNNRYLCQRWVPKGTTRSQSLLASGTMEGSDFTLVPRAGRALEFVYRMSYYERPMIDLSGQHFTVLDSTALGVHRADASSLELSDAALSLALEWIAVSDGRNRQAVEMGPDGYPVIWLKSSRKQDDVHVEAKSYRLSFVRAALMITSARHEAQLKCVVDCIKAGSPSKATKALAESYLKPTRKLIEYAGNPSRKKESALLRDLKLGVNHIDIDQLRRNALLSPRYPTELLELSANVEDVVETPDAAKGVDLFGVSNTIFKVKCSATVSLAAPENELRANESYLTEDGQLAETYKEEWVVYRSLKEFQILHKHLKLQVSATESSGTAGSRLVGAATAAFAATTASIGRNRQRKMLIPSLSQASKAGALGVTKKVIFKRKEILDGYLGYILSPGHLLGRCSELLLFLGASFPLDPSVRMDETFHTTGDLLGRTEMSRSVLLLKSEPPPDFFQNEDSSRAVTGLSTATSNDSQEDDMLFDDDVDGDQNQKFNVKEEMENAAVRTKIEKVRLPLVRTRIFDLLRYQFGFENASFARNRLLAALKTASFAVTSAADFRKTLYKLHIEHLNSEAVAGWINMLIDLLWPNGKFFESSPPLSPEEIKAQADKARELLHSNFPDQVRAILGSELTRDGLDIFHEMLQNRMVVKSMAYMLFDHLWLEIFPEIGDVLSCGAAIDVDSKDH